VVSLRRTAAYLGGLVLLHLPAHGAILIHEYALRGSLNDNVSGDPLSSYGGQITALGYVFAGNQGLTFSSRDFTPADYSIELSFRLDTTAGTTKLIDFHNLTADPGLYQQSGAIAFSPAATASISDFRPGTDVHVVLTRDGATNLVTAYVNGQQRLTFVDDLLLGAPPGFSNRLSFFMEDGNQSNISGGTANYVRIFNGALNATEVSTLFAAGPPIAVPEPSTVVLLALGTLAVVSTVRRRIRG
jgi:hypothetical protein